MHVLEPCRCLTHLKVLEHICSPDASLGPDVGQGARRVCKGIYLKLAPKHGRRQQDANDADEKPSQHPALDGRVVLL